MSSTPIFDELAGKYGNPLPTTKRTTKAQRRKRKAATTSATQKLPVAA